MPCVKNLEKTLLAKTKSKKSCKKSIEECEVNCCIPECEPDCCTPAFQRLDKLRNQWLFVNMPSIVNQSAPSNPGFINRAGQVITDPTSITDVNNTSVPIYNFPALTIGNNEERSYYFVNVVRYLNFEECGKQDQVIGWTVDLQTENIILYQYLDELNIGPETSRSVLLNLPLPLTTEQKTQLKNLQAFWKLSLKVIERVGENPKEEGNICEITDKCGTRWLIAINRVYGSSSVCDYNSKFTIVAVKLC